MDIAERRASQDGKIRRRFEGQTMEFRCATALENRRKNGDAIPQQQCRHAESRHTDQQ